MKWKFTTAPLPDYLEEALAPFAWSGIFSADFRREIIVCIYSTEREEVTSEFIKALRHVKFLDQKWVDELSGALTRFAKEGFPKKKDS